MEQETMEEGGSRLINPESGKTILKEDYIARLAKSWHAPSKRLTSSTIVDGQVFRQKLAAVRQWSRVLAASEYEPGFGALSVPTTKATNQQISNDQYPTKQNGFHDARASRIRSISRAACSSARLRMAAKSASLLIPGRYAMLYE